MLHTPDQPSCGLQQLAALPHCLTSLPLPMGRWLCHLTQGRMLNDAVASSLRCSSCRDGHPHHLLTACLVTTATAAVADAAAGPWGLLQPTLTPMGSGTPAAHPPAIKSFITRLNLRLGPTYACPLRTYSSGSVYSQPVRAVFRRSPMVPFVPGTCMQHVE